jgi:hypothetical protein
MTVTTPSPVARGRRPAARRRPRAGAGPAWGPVAAVAAVGAVVLATQPMTADMAAQTFRGWLWEEHGFTVWNGQWYGGHHVPAYSLLFPPLASLLGPRFVGALAGVAATAAFARIAARQAPAPARAGPATWLFAGGVAANVVVGRMPFTLGVAFAVAAWARATGGERPWRLAFGAVLSLLAVWSSPVAGFFLALAAAGLVLAGTPGAAPWRRAAPVPAGTGRRIGRFAPVPAGAGRWPRGLVPALALAVPAVVGGLLPPLLFGEGGTERFVATAFWPMAGAMVLVMVLADPRLRPAVALYLAVLVAAFVAPEPVGQNATRLGVLLAPALLVLAPRDRAPRWALIPVIAGLVYLQWLPAWRAVEEARGDPAAELAFHAEAADVLTPRLPPGERVEVVFTRNHWEASHLASRVPLARGWERQLDRRANALFYTPGLDAARYRAWLDANAVRFVALPNAPLDLSARAEAELVRSEPAYLRAVHASPRWRIYEVLDAAPAVRGPARLVARTPDSLILEATGPGRLDLKERFSRWWRVAAGRACVREGPDHRVRVEVEAAGRVELRAALRGRRCR